MNLTATASFRRMVAVVLFAALGLVNASAQQQPLTDSSFTPRIDAPAYPSGQGAVVGVDEAHFNYHTAEGRYKPFAELLRRDGYRVLPVKAEFTRDVLRQFDILVIANALSKEAASDWNLPAAHSAFTGEEIAAVRDWVKQGGALFLIVDHRPMPGAVRKLAEAFGANWSDGYAQHRQTEGPLVFRREDGSLADHPITNGRNDRERIDSVATFTGSAFQAQNAIPLLTFKSDVESVMAMPVAGVFKPDAPRIDVTDWQQGTVLRVGKGRMALFGEAAMFTAQLAGPDREPVGMNAPIAAQNYQLLLNVVRWLSGVLEDERK